MRPWMIPGLIMLAGGVATGVYFMMRAPRVTDEQIIFTVRSSGGMAEIDQGYFMTGSGKVQRFNFYADHNFTKHHSLPKNPTHADLMNGFGTVFETTAQIPASTIKEMLTLVPAASSGVLACYVTGADMSTTTYEAWRRNSQGVYSSVLLAALGNEKCVNTAPEAAVLVAWSHKVVTQSNSRFEISAAPLQVRDCGECHDDGLCVVSTEDDKYCLQRRGCKDDSCACNGFVCAGGRAHCREVGPGVLTCVP